MMSQTGEFELLEGTIQANKHGLRVCFIFSLIPILGGVTTMVLGVTGVQNLLFDKPLLPGAGKFLLTFGGTFVSSLSVVPFKDILAKKDRIRYLESLKKQLSILEKNAQKNLTEIKKLKTRIWDYCEKISL